MSPSWSTAERPLGWQVVFTDGCTSIKPIKSKMWSAKFSGATRYVFWWLRAYRPQIWNPWKIQMYRCLFHAFPIKQKVLPIKDVKEWWWPFPAMLSCQRRTYDLQFYTEVRAQTEEISFIKSSPNRRGWRSTASPKKAWCKWKPDLVKKAIRKS